MIYQQWKNTGTTKSSAANSQNHSHASKNMLEETNDELHNIDTIEQSTPDQSLFWDIEVDEWDEILTLPPSK
eukprot:4506600-Ditylum_brightwellii.AAC.1